MRVASWFIVVSLAVAPAAAAAGAKYESKACRDLLEKVITAHGGMERWSKASTLSFTHILTFGPPLAAEWGISDEVTEIKTLRTYQAWPLDDAILGNDSKRTWTKNWKGFSYPNMNVNQFYRTLSMPWSIASMPYVVGAPAKGTLLQDSTEYATIRLGFDPSTGESPERYYRLFIHPETFRIKAVEYTVTYGAFLDLAGVPKEQKFYGPVTHVYFDYTTVDGLLFPKKYDTLGQDGNRYGSHVAYNYSLTKPFDESKMRVPEGAAFDNSSATRQ
jgi:hypothetical protein